MGAILALFIIASVSLIVVRVGATALMMTGISWDSASFQSYSAFFGVGFTTREAEMVVNHPLRRRIIRDLILAGNIGLTTALATLIVTFVQSDDTSQTINSLGLIGAGIIVLILLSKLGFLKRLLDRLIRHSLERAGVVHALDYELLLRVEAGYCISEIDVLPDSPVAGKSLAESRPADMGVVILSIQRDDGTFTGAPGAQDRIVATDVITAYGHESDLSKLTQGGDPDATAS
ncbi:MAG: TrkA C-terminal domain-containing protein [Verrucomicrobiales bacterium]